MHEDGTASGSFRRVRWFHVAALAAVIVGSFILTHLTARDLRAVGEYLATTNLGQTDGLGNAIYGGYGEPYDSPGLRGVTFPSRVALDTVNHRLFVTATTGNNGHRMHVFQLNPNDTVGSRDATTIFGQTNVKGSANSTTQSTFRSTPGRPGFNPTTQQLFVPDIDSNRVVVFDVASPSLGANATDLLGQLDEDDEPIYTIRPDNGPPTSRTMSQPAAVAHDAVGHRLFVADTQNNRVLMFELDTDDTLLDNQADAVLGQQTFSDNDCESGAEGLCLPVALAYDPDDDRLFVAEDGEENNRVVVFDVSSVTNGQDAINVLGAGDLNGGDCDNTPACQFSGPTALAYDIPNDHLFVADGGNARVLVFDTDPGLITDGEDAINVLGAADFDGTPCANPGQCDFDYPSGLAYDEHPGAERLFVVDNDNASVLVFDLSGGVTDGMDASNIIGYADFSFTVCPGAIPSQCGVPGAIGLAYDYDDNRLFVSSQTAYRVTVFDVAFITDGEDAVNVLGQPDYVSSLSGPTISNLLSPNGLAYAPDGDLLFVADTSDHRIMIFDADTGTIADGEDADDVLGQFDPSFNPVFTTGLENNAPNNRGLVEPEAALVDTVNDRLFVADTGNNRVLVFDLSGGVLVDHSADHVLGQATFSTAAANTTSASFNTPKALAYDSDGDRLFVGDLFNNRVLVFDTTSIDDGEGAVNVIGQTDFVSSAFGTSSTSFSGTIGGDGVYGLTYDGVGDRLFVVDRGNNRVLVFDGTAIADGMAASNVLGQEDFVSLMGATAVDGLSSPGDVEFSAVANRLFVVDAGNQRVMIFDTTLIANGEDAVDVLGQTDDTGQPSFTTNGRDDTPNRFGYKEPRAVVVDSANNRLWVTDDSRMTMMETDDDGDVVDREEDVVFGQPDFKTTANGTSQTQVQSFLAAAVLDTSGDRMFVADWSNHRVLVYDIGGSPANGASADFVIGQPDFITGTSGTGAQGLNRPSGLAYDTTGNRLFVADRNNHRVLVFDGTAIADGMAASNVLGQPDFITTTSGTDPVTLFQPIGLAYDDATQRLFVADANNNRVMVFDVADITNGEAAINVLGQDDFVSGLVNKTGGTSTQSGLELEFTFPGLAFDPDTNRLWVSDPNAHRVLVFDVDPATIADGEDAAGVLGQGNFTDSTSGKGQGEVSGPNGLGWDADRRRLYVADNNNHRVMVFDLVRITTETLPDPVLGQPYSEDINSDQSQGTVTYTLASGTLPPGMTVGSLSGTPTTPGTYTFTVEAADASGVSSFTDAQTYTVTIAAAGAGGGGFVPPPGSTPTPSAGSTPAPTVPGATPRRTPTGSRTPTPTTIAGVSPGPTSSGMPTSPGPSTSPGPGTPTAIDRLLGDRALERVVAVTSMLIAAVSILAILLSAVLLSRNLMDLAFMGAFALQSLWVILGLKKRARIWGTVYDSSNKHPIPFAKVELTDLNGRVLETRFADRDGRYGFLTSPEQMHQQSLTVRIRAAASGYLFPPVRVAAGATDFLVYEHVYTGGPVTVAAESFLHFDVPMDRQLWRPTRFSEFLPLKSAGGFMSHLMNIAFWAGVILVPLAYWQQPTTLNLVILIAFFGVHALRMLTGMYRPFGVVRDATGGKAVSYALVTLNDAQGKRRTFAVSDEQGRYFMSSDAGTYQLQTFTPANVTPQRTKTEMVTTGSGWVKKKLAV